jgi:peroxiredoxin Q/BCP
MKRFTLLASCAFAVILLAAGIAAEDAKLKVGDAAPDFAIPEGTAKDQIGDAKNLSDLKGKNVVLAFYPKAFTPGCTNQMCGYRDDFSAFESTDTVVLAISVDEQAESNRFKDEHKLPFAVLGDPKHEIIQKYGVELLSRNDFQYAKRTTFLVDKEGKIAYIDWNYDFAKGKEPLLAAIKELNKAN